MLNVWCLGCALIGTHLAATWGRKSIALVSQSLLIVSLFIVGGLTKIYADNPDGASQSLIYGDVAVMFLFQGFYSLAWTPLLYLYPPEVLNYSVRANGVALSQLVLNGLALLLTFVEGIGLTNIGWKMYMINASWDVIVLVLIVSNPSCPPSPKGTLLHQPPGAMLISPRRYIGLRLKAKHSRKSMQSSKARNTHWCLTSRTFCTGRRQSRWKTLTSTFMLRRWTNRNEWVGVCTRLQTCSSDLILWFNLDALPTQVSLLLL